MQSASAAYDEVNRQWKSACKVLLGGEVGELDEFAEWLYDYNGPRFHAKSAVSGEDVLYSDGRYSKKARWMGLDEAPRTAERGALSVNDIKDIDSILRALGEKAVYTGNIWLGNSSGVEDSTTIIDSHYVYKSEWVTSSKYVAYSTHVIGDWVFGGHCVSSNFHIRSNSYMAQRCVEVSRVDWSSDCYYSHGLSACDECMFCFNLKSKRQHIGNLALSKEKYAALKRKLLAEMREKLMKDKRLPHHFDMFQAAKPDYSRLKSLLPAMPPEQAQKTDRQAAETAFSEVSALIFGRPYAGLDRYGAWLTRNTAKFEDGQSCASGRKLLVPDYAEFLRFPRGRLLDDHEAAWLGERLALTAQEAESLTLSNAPKTASPIAYFCNEWLVGNLANNIDCPLAIDASDCYRSIINIRCKRCAFGWWPRESEYLFGYNRARQCAYCINCFHSEKLKRCFEVSEGRSCSDCYFSHNIENCSDCMFCFNVKNLKHAIANVELGRERYTEAKKRVLDELNQELAKTDQIAMSIFNLVDCIPSKK